MPIFDFLRRPKPPETLEIPVFPLNTVLFPGGMLRLKVFEARYLDMAAACLREHTPFGVCLVSAGQEGQASAQAHPVGTLANILNADMEQAGILLISVQGDRRFHIRETAIAADGLQRSRIEFFAANPVNLPAERRRLLPLLLRIVSDLGPEKIPEPHAFDDADWVGFRLTEVLPIPNLAKQKLLELDDPLSRLEVLEKYLDQRKLLP